MMPHVTGSFRVENWNLGYDIGSGTAVRTDKSGDGHGPDRG